MVGGIKWGEKSTVDIVSRFADLHWSEEEQMYCDVSVNEEGKVRAMHLALGHVS